MAKAVAWCNLLFLAIETGIIGVTANHVIMSYEGAFAANHNVVVGDEDIAARFFVNTSVVKQRLRLAAVSPRLLDIYAEDGMTLEQLMAFTVTAYHARQEQVWDTVSRSYSKEPYLIRRQLTEGAVRAADRRALFVGTAAYEAAGGAVMRDLVSAG